jgi:hypothetical protein
MRQVRDPYDAIQRYVFVINQDDRRIHGMV